MKKRSSIIKDILISTGFLAHSILFSFLFFIFYVAYGLSLTMHDPFPPLAIISAVIPILNVSGLIILSSKRFIHSISCIISFIVNTSLSVIILLWVLDNCGFDLDRISSVQYLIILIFATVVVVFGSLASTIISFKNSAKKPR